MRRLTTRPELCGALPIRIGACGEPVFFDRLMQVFPEQDGVVQPDVPVRLLAVDCPQSATLGLP